MYELFYEIGLNKKEIEEILQSKKYHRIRKSHYTSLNKPTDREKKIMKLLYEKYRMPFLQDRNGFWMCRQFDS